jgi:hypothetical protein
MKPGPKPTDTETRFWRFVDKWHDGCWRWVGGIHKTGYGLFTIYQRGTVWAHRYSYEMAKGPIPAGMQLDHLCRVHNCVNPDHLEVVTPRENVMRGDTIARENLSKTHCPKGHPYSPENTQLTNLNQRRCKTCQRIRWVKWYRKKNGLPMQNTSTSRAFIEVDI